MKKISKELKDRFDAVVSEYENGRPLSFSALKAFSDSPFTFIMRGVKEQSSSMRLGQLEHMAVLEPEKFKAIPIIRKVNESKTWGGTENRKLMDEFKKKYGDDFMKEQQAKDALMYRLAIEMNPEAIKIVSAAKEMESSLSFDFLGSKFRGFIDFKYERGGVLHNADLKKMSFAFGDANEWSISRRVRKLKLNWQQVLYNHAAFDDIAREATLIIIDSNLNVNVVTLTSDFLMEGYAEIQQLMEDYYSCIASGNWYRSGDVYEI